MNARSIASHLAVAGLAFALGWVGSGSREDSGPIGLSISEEPVAGFAAVLRIDDPGERAVALAAFFERTDVEWAIRLREAVNTEDSDLVLDETAETLFATWWARSDPAAALEHRVKPAWSHRNPWVRSVFREWTRRDPLAAIAAVQTLPEAPIEGRLEGARIILDDWFARKEVADPTPLVALLPQLEVKPRARAIKQLIETMIETAGVDETERFVESVPWDTGSIGLHVKPELMARMAIALLDHDIDRAKSWADRHGEGRKGSGIRKHLAFQWGLKDGPAAMEWAMSLPDSLERPAIIKRAWLSFNRKQSEAAREWLSARAPDGNLQGIYAEFLTNVVRRDPDRAVALANSATEPEVREKMLMAVGRGWILSDPEAAFAWLDRSGLSADQVQQLRSWADKAARNRKAS